LASSPEESSIESLAIPVSAAIFTFGRDVGQVHRVAAFEVGVHRHLQGAGDETEMVSVSSRVIWLSARPSVQAWPALVVANA